MFKAKQEITKESVIAALAKVEDAETGQDVISAGIVSSIIVKGDSVGFALEVDINQAAEKESLRKQCEEAVRAISGVQKVTAVMTSSKPGMFASAPKTAQAQSSPSRHASQEPEKFTIPGVKYVVLVASGKGGVGKSTVSVNLARALAAAGKKVGIVDVDIYGPSIPKMLGLAGKPEVDDKNRMVPKESEGIKSLSIGYLVDEDNALAWRSSMALKAMNQLLRATLWGELDYLVVDTPPGTGDIQLSLAKHYNLAGAVMVSTPQDVALADAKKAATMFRRVQVPVLGMVENMSYFEDTSGVKQYIFGQGGARAMAENLEIPFLGEIPLRQDIREAGDAGLAVKDFSAMEAIARNVITHIEGGK